MVVAHHRLTAETHFNTKGAQGGRNKHISMTIFGPDLSITTCTGQPRARNKDFVPTTKTGPNPDLSGRRSRGTELKRASCALPRMLSPCFVPARPFGNRSHDPTFMGVVKLSPKTAIFVIMEHRFFRGTKESECSTYMSIGWLTPQTCGTSTEDHRT